MSASNGYKKIGGEERSHKILYDHLTSMLHVDLVPGIIPPKLLSPAGGLLPGRTHMGPTNAKILCRLNATTLIYLI